MSSIKYSSAMVVQSLQPNWLAPAASQSGLLAALGRFAASLARLARHAGSFTLDPAVV
jgi:hypothetical protein